MALNFNGNIPEVITFNNNDVLVVKWNGTVVWEKNTMPKCLAFVATSSGTFTFIGSTRTNRLSYSVDSGETWSSESQNITVNVSSGDIVLWKGELVNQGYYGGGIGTFGGTATFEAQGNIMSLIYGDNFEEQTEFDNLDGGDFQGLFADTSIESAENLELPVSELTDYCYQYMFSGCTLLETAPTLSAETLVDGCYDNMFNGCSSLSYIKMIATDITATDCLNNWVANVAASGTFVKSADMTTLPIDSVNGIPSGWTVEDDVKYLPISDFNFNYNFKNYDSATQTVPNDPNANWQQDLVLQGTPVVSTDHITVTNSDAYAQFPFDSISENIFNRNNSSEMTIIYKVSGCSGIDLISNRGYIKDAYNGAYNWMVRPQSNNRMYLHDSNGEKGGLTVTTNPNIVVMKVDANRFLTIKSITDNTSVTNVSCYFNQPSGRMCFFSANFSDINTTYINERFNGVCYWMFQANRVLTDSEINDVIIFNETL